MFIMVWLMFSAVVAVVPVAFSSALSPPLVAFLWIDFEFFAQMCVHVVSQLQGAQEEFWWVWGCRRFPLLQLLVVSVVAALFHCRFLVAVSLAMLLSFLLFSALSLLPLCPYSLTNRDPNRECHRMSAHS